MNSIAKRRPAPEIVLVGKREVISTGQLNISLVADKIIRDGANEWVPISDVAKFAYGKSFLANNKRVRGAIWRLRRELLARGVLLISEGTPAEHLKIYVGGELERQLAGKLLKTMRKRGDISTSLYETAVRLVAPEEQPPSAA